MDFENLEFGFRFHFGSLDFRFISDLLDISGWNRPFSFVRRSTLAAQQQGIGQW